MALPTDSNERKRIPLMTGCIDYFLDALVEVAKVSVFGNDKHNPGMPLGWTRGLSEDHADCAVRHLAQRGGYDGGVRESALAAWRALANLQDELQREGLCGPTRGQRTLEQWEALRKAMKGTDK